MSSLLQGMEFMQNRFQPSRREFLAGLGGVSLAALLPRVSFAQSLPLNPDVAIIGAGGAGLSAARTLMQAGKNVVILEAMSRIGGRAYTESATFGVPFDWGCQWIQAADRNPLLPLAKEWGFDPYLHDLELDRIYYGATPRRFTQREMDRTKAIEERFPKINRRAARWRDGPVSSVLVPRTPEEEAAMTYMFPMDMAVDPGELSIRDWARQTDLAPNYLVQKGLGTVVAKFGEGLPVSLSTPVKRIRYGGKGVAIETEKGDVQAKACIITASTGALQSGFIRFDPKLPDWKEDAIGELPMGLLAKIPLLLDGERFGLSPFDDILYERSGLQDIYFLCFPFGMNMMIGFVGGSFAWHLTAEGTEAATDFALDALRRLFGEKAPSHVKKAEFSRWANIPWVRGSYAAALPGKAGARTALARPIADRLYFAGEALAGPLAQTIGGAILSGEAVARDVLKQIA